MTETWPKSIHRLELCGGTKQNLLFPTSAKEIAVKVKPLLRSEKQFLQYSGLMKRRRLNEQGKIHSLIGLPRELIDQVLSWLPAFEVWRLREVCRTVRSC